MKRFVIGFGITTAGAVIGFVIVLYEILIVRTAISDGEFILFLMSLGYAVLNLYIFNWAITEYEKEING